MAATTGTRYLVPTPSQTAGPFVSIGTDWDATGLLVPEPAEGAISVVGQVLDGAGAPVTDAMLEFWQADPAGQFPLSPAGESPPGSFPSGGSPSGGSPSGGSPSGGSPSGGSSSGGSPSGGSPSGASSSSSWRWTGFARALTDDQGRYRLVTLKPGPVPGAGGQPQAPHIDVSIFARGLLQRLVTRIYFPDEEELNATDPVLSSLGDAGLVSRLVALHEADSPSLRFDIRLQGDEETVFFAPWCA